VSVLGYGDDASAYTEAGRHAKRGFLIEQLKVDDWKARPLFCVEHTPGGPPWWKSNGGNGKRPAAFTIGLGL